MDDLQRSIKRPSRRFAFFCVCSTLSFLISAAIYFLISRHYPPLVQPFRTSSAYPWSPVPSQERELLIAFHAELTEHSPFKGRPRQDLDERWDSISDLPMILIDEDGMRNLRQPTSNAKAKDGKYYAMIEVFHQLHCLNLIRKYIWRDFYPKEPAFQGTIEGVYVHIDHCIDVIRQVLMCHADTDLITFTDRGPGSSPLPRFSTTHMCRNFTEVARWAEEHDSEL